MADAYEALKHRRQLHRDSMRRHRQRQVDGFTSMRTTLKQLMRQFKQLDHPAKESSQLLKDYRDLALAVQRLQEEQLQLQGNVVLWQKAMARLAVTMDDYLQNSTPVPARMLQDPSETVPLQFEELQEPGIQQVISRCSANLRMRDRQCDPASLDAVNMGTNFGWSIVCDLSDESDVFVRMTKRLTGITAHQAMARTWETTSNPALYPHLGPVRHKVIQVVPQRAYVEVRDMPTHGQFETVQKRSCMMAFMVKTERGYAIGMGSLAPDQRPKGDSKGDFVEHSSWTEVADDIDGCSVVTIRYRGQYNSGDTPHRRFVNLLSSVRRWEDLVTNRLLKLVN